MKLKSISITLFLAVALLFSSCSKEPKNLAAIPKNASFLISFDVYSIAKKGNFKEAANYSFVQKIKDELRSENKDLYKILEGFMEDPASAGINFKSNMYMYMINPEKRKRYLCYNMELSSKSDFETIINNIITEVEKEEQTKSELIKKNGYSMRVIENDAAIVWDDDKAVLIGAIGYKSGEDLEETVDYIFGLKKEERAVSIAEFRSFVKEEKDVNFWFSTNSILDNFIMGQVQRSAKVDISNTYYTATMDFRDGELNIKNKLYPGKGLKEFMEKNNTMGETVNDELLEYYSEGVNGFMRAALKPMAFYEIISQIDESGKMEKEVEREMDMTLEEILKSFGGNVSFGLTGFEVVEFDYEGWGYVFNEADAVKLPMMPIGDIDRITPDDIKQLNEGKTIRVYKRYQQYGVNISNILAEGGTAETAIENNSNVIWYEGGWDYKDGVQKHESQLLPLLTLVLDINNTKTIEQIKKMTGEFMKEDDGHYRFMFANKYPAYFAYNDKHAIVTNSVNDVKAFKEGGYKDKSIAQSDLKADMGTSPFYAYMNLDYDAYPLVLKEKLEGNLGKAEQKALDIWTELAKNATFKSIDDYSAEISVKVKKDEKNILSTVLKTIEDNYAYFLAL